MDVPEARDYMRSAMNLIDDAIDDLMFRTEDEDDLLRVLGKLSRAEHALMTARIIILKEYT